MYFLPLISYRLALEIKKASSKYLMYKDIVAGDMEIFFLLLKVSDNFLGLTNDEIFEAKISKSSLIFVSLVKLYQFIIYLK